MINMAKRNWKDVADEMCHCGHKKSEHNDTISKGHGECKHFYFGACLCRKFVWKTFIDKDGKVLK